LVYTSISIVSQSRSIGVVFDEVIYNIDDNLLSGGYNLGANYIDSQQFDGECLFTSEQFPDAATIEIEVYTNITNNNGLQGYFSNSTGLWYTTTFYLRMAAQTSEFGLIEAEADSYVNEGSTIRMNDLIPKKVKQSDFILSFIKMFNLYIQQDEYDPTHLIVRTRDKFYDDGSELDWTDKIDIKSLDVELISNKQNKRKLFTYKEDSKDKVGVSYKEETNETYGQLEYVFENEFIKDISKVEPIFSPTFLIEQSDRGGVYRTVPYIYAREPKNNIRVLYVGDVVKGSWSYYNGAGNVPGNFTDYNKFRFTGHLYPNNVNPVLDLHFGICDYYSHVGPVTNNNLYNKHYRNQMNILDNGHILTAYFNLTYLDITNLNLSDRIYVYDSWWNINKITDFDLNQKKLTKVELISADTDISVFVEDNDVSISKSRQTSINRVINKESIDRSTSNTYGSDSKYNQVLGSNNVIQPSFKNNVVVGNENNVSGYRNIIQGSNNNVKW
jgi:hypothetical protein